MMRERWKRPRGWIPVLVGWLVLLPATLHAVEPASMPDMPSVAQGGMGPGADVEPVVLTGALFPDYAGQPISRLAVYRWNDTAGQFEQIASQVDERLDRVFNAGTELEFTQNIHDIFDQEPDTLDDDDEVVFLFRDAGPRAPVEADWPPDTDDIRYEIELRDGTDPAAPARYAYLYAGDSHPGPPNPMIQWDLSVTTSIQTPLFSLDYLDRWLLTGFRVFDPCGDGGDLIDRLKGRAGLAVDQGETEQLWNAAAIYMGGLAGPVRAIRYIRGAASGFNTIHHDIVYPDLFERRVDLRVHPLDNLWFYLDWLPGRADTLFSPDNPSGTPIDGQPDNGLGTGLVDWEVVRGPAGGLAILYDVPPSPFVLEYERYQRDDNDFDDAPVYPPGYPDEDDSAFGNHGVHLRSLSGSETDDIVLRTRVYPLCAGVGSAADGEGFLDYWRNPPQASTFSQERMWTPIRDLQASLDGGDVLLQWSPSNGASSYRVYESEDPSIPFDSWTLLQETTETFFRHAGAAAGPPVFYSVTVVKPSGEEVR